MVRQRTVPGSPDAERCLAQTRGFWDERLDGLARHPDRNVEVDPRRTLDRLLAARASAAVGGDERRA